MKHFKVAGIELDFETSPDLFSPKALDMGSELLLSTLPKFQYSTALDWGCGWGAIAMWLAKNNPQAKIIAIDSDIAAVKAASQNSAHNNLHNISVLASHSYSDVPKNHRFDLVLSNPPTHRGREVVEDMIQASHGRLNPGGSLLMVVESRIKPWVARQMKTVFGDYKIVKRSPKHVVVMAKNSL